ncbi:MAG TPA: DUF6387 family protein [Gammaproteobacteria bacterium]|nr:hypothetical protein [Micavibrio sp.]HQW57657.1 DUF6387 family protein [Gammaproteobacteria bacterium]
MNESSIVLSLQKFKPSHKTTNPKEISKWFPIGDYRKISCRDAVFWYEQLVIRREMLSFQSAPKKYSAETKDLLARCMKEIQKSPYLNLQNHELLRIGGKRLLFAKKRISTLNFGQGVKEMTLKDVELLLKSIRQNKNKLGHTLNDYIAPANTYMVQHEKHKIPTFINYNLPDDILMADFQRHLSEQRKKEHLSHNRKARSTVLGNWKANGILPYLDLVIWATNSKIYLSWPDIAEILFQDRFKHEDVRKTTHETAAFALTSIALEQLFYWGINAEVKTAKSLPRFKY